MFRNISRKAKAILSVAAIVAVGSGAVFAGFTPANRPTYDWNNPADRQGSTTGPVFNSFINTPDYGDERAFFDASLNGSEGSYKDVLAGATGTREVTLRTYVHNNGNQNLNASGVSIAKDTKVRITLPSGTDKMLRARSYISASNAAEVTDTTELVDTKAFSISYVPGSAKLFNNAHKAGLSLGDEIVADGSTIGYDQMNGDFPGCFEYATTVEIKVRINVADLEVDKKVRIAGQTEFVDQVTAKPGDRIQYAIFVKNSGTATLNDINVRDVLPPHMTLNPDSVKWYDATQNGAAQADKPLFDGGINFGAYGAGANFYVRFSTTAKDDFAGCEITARNLAFVKTAQNPAEVQDFADVKIVKENCTPPAKLVTCDALTAPKLTLKTGESTTFTANATATNTTITGYTFSVNGAVVQNSAANSYTFTQNTAGTYTVAVQVTSPIGTVTSPACAKTVDVVTNVTPTYRCEALTLSAKAVKVGEKVTATVRFTAKDGAAFKLATFKWGDNTENFVTNKATGDLVTAEHVYTTKGTYGMQVKLDFDVNGSVKSVEGGNCVAQVNVDVTPPPTEIPNTGAGSIAAIFAGVTLAGATLHNIFVRRSIR